MFVGLNSFVVSYNIKGDKMNHILIMNYIRKLSKEEVIQFIRMQNICMTNEEIDVIYHYLKTRAKEFLSGNHQGILDEIKNQVSSATYSKILEYYQMYKEKL